jgi:hypothetical protein
MILPMHATPNMVGHALITRYKKSSILVVERDCILVVVPSLLSCILVVDRESAAMAAVAVAAVVVTASLAVFAAVAVPASSTSPHGPPIIP